MNCRYTPEDPFNGSSIRFMPRLLQERGYWDGGELCVARSKAAPKPEHKHTGKRQEDWEL